MARACSLGFPRIGLDRELKKVTESHWKGAADKATLLETAADLRARHWRLQAQHLDVVPSNDFAHYDQMLDMAVLLGAVPARFNHQGGKVDLGTYFTMARGTTGVPAMEMTKWFDTNYHYIVPEFDQDTRFALSTDTPFDALKEAKALGIDTRPVLIGPMTFLKLGKIKDGSVSATDLIDRLIPVYADLLAKLAAAGVDEVQIDEPILVTDLSADWRAAFQPAYDRLAKAAPELKIHLATYFGALGDNLSLVSALPVHGLHVDLVRAPDQLDAVLKAWPE